MKSNYWLLVAALLCFAGALAGSSGPSAAIGICFLVIFILRRRGSIERQHGVDN